MDDVEFFGTGGTSALNYYVWMKPPAADVDAFEALGNPGWNWADFDKYSKKTERFRFNKKFHVNINSLLAYVRSFHVPTKERTDLYPHTYDLDFRGTSGPIQVTFPPHYHAVDTLVNETLVNKGLKANKDPHGGDVRKLYRIGFQ